MSLSLGYVLVTGQKVHNQFRRKCRKNRKKVVDILIKQDKKLQRIKLGCARSDFNISLSIHQHFPRTHAVIINRQYDSMFSISINY
jgi:hypothetical protein